jgi:hypothetical protein
MNNASSSTDLRSGYRARKDSMRGMRLREQRRLFGLVRSSDGSGFALCRLRKRSDESGRHAARSVARNGGRAMPEILKPTCKPSFAQLSKAGDRAAGI